MSEKPYKRIRVENQVNEEVETFLISKDWKELDDVFEHYWGEMWDSFLDGMADEIYDLYLEWKEKMKNIIRDDIDEGRKSLEISGFEIREAEEGGDD